MNGVTIGPDGKFILFPFGKYVFSSLSDLTLILYSTKSGSVFLPVRIILSLTISSLRL